MREASWGSLSHRRLCSLSTWLTTHTRFCFLIQDHHHHRRMPACPCLLSRACSSWHCPPSALSYSLGFLSKSALTVLRICLPTSPCLGVELLDLWRLRSFLNGPCELTGLRSVLGRDLSGSAGLSQRVLEVECGSNDPVLEARLKSGSYSALVRSILRRGGEPSVLTRCRAALCRVSSSASPCVCTGLLS